MRTVNVYLPGMIRGGRKERVRADRKVGLAAPGKKKKVNIKPYLFLAVPVLLLIWWIYRPMLETLRYSFYDWNMIPGTQARFVGLQNFVKLFTNKDFGTAVVNTLVYIVGMLPFSVVIPIFLSVATQGLKDTDDYGAGCGQHDFPVAAPSEQRTCQSCAANPGYHGKQHFFFC